ncbi:serine O-acetyltransferase [Candidatus Pantoea edessiphila]|uniref:Serine acetyltransferase n=1 Tax=Candidatus Pantoea edessiphila TaxID=2044610 RepID=A0A2P5SZ50_9GAMM|nr:serine O-acetyltransferase [Candidatus Pantoea edessiphila]MBK4775278.1 serine O-acetyltransferase [Pantoea sp. Edef]PPI87583.1 serine O-acetyltransferase [Candidatus Pantoea edessiphila]
MFFNKLELVWSQMKREAHIISNSEPLLASFYHETLLKHANLSNAQSYILSNKIANAFMPAINVREILEEAYSNDLSIITSSVYDIQAIIQRDPAVNEYSIPLLYLKGFQALQCYRISHWLWNQGRNALAIYLQNEISAYFGVDIHPAAKIGKGIMLDHATGIVIGETAVIENDVSILQSVTLGSTGKVIGDRHPKIREGVMIGAGAKVLGNIEIGKGAKIGAGSVVLKNVPPNTTAAGIPARIVGKTNSQKTQKTSMEMDQYFNSLVFQLGDGI